MGKGDSRAVGRALIVSDTHGRLEGLREAIREASPFGLLIHLGDLCGQAERVRGMTPGQVEMVAGNGDTGSGLPAEALVPLGNRLAWCVHGHRHMAGYGGQALKDGAGRQGASIALYGHAHWPALDLEGPVAAVCPGSLTWPRQPGGRLSYALAAIDVEGEVSFSIHYL